MIPNDRTVDVVVSFLTQEEGGRTNRNPACLTGNRYRPHFLKVDDEPENLIGVGFESGTDLATPGKEWPATVILLFQSREILPPNTRFQIREGVKVVGEGRARAEPRLLKP